MWYGRVDYTATPPTLDLLQRHPDTLATQATTRLPTVPAPSTVDTLALVGRVGGMSYLKAQGVWNAGKDGKYTYYYRWDPARPAELLKVWEGWQCWTIGSANVVVGARPDRDHRLIETLVEDDPAGPSAIYHCVMRDSGTRRWAHEDRCAGTIAGGATRVVNLTLDANLVGVGTHTGALIIDSNDFITPTLTIPITFTVGETAPLTVAIDIDDDAGIAPHAATCSAVISNGVPFTAGSTLDGGTITARGQNLPNEGAAKVVDGSASSKWLDFATVDPGTRASWLAYAYAGPARTVTTYALTSANDAPERDPFTWALEGSNNGGSTWTVVDQRSAQTFASRGLRRSFTVATPGRFAAYRLRIDRVANPTTANSVQLAELELIGAAGYEVTWAFGDGTTGVGAVATHAWAASGTYTVTVTDAHGATATASRVVSVTAGRTIRMVLLPDHLWDALAPSSATVADPVGGHQDIHLPTHEDALLVPVPTNGG